MIDTANSLPRQESGDRTAALLSRLAARASLDWWIALAIVLFSAALYRRTMQPTLGGTIDSEELQYVIHTMGLAHATGYPLFLILGKMWTVLFPVGEIAFRVTLFSSVWALGTVALTYYILRHLTNRRMASILGTLILATAEPFWSQAGMAQVGTFTTFLTAALILCLLLWREGRVPLEACAFIYGLGLSHHRSALFYAPGILLFIVLSQPSALRSTRLVLRSLGLMILPFVAYIYVPLRAAAGPDFVTDLPSFFRYVTGSGFAHYIVDDGTSKTLFRARLIPELFRAWFSVLGIALAVFGLVRWVGSRMHSADSWAASSLLGLALVLVTLFTVTFGETERYLLVPVMILAIACGMGAARLAQIIDNLGRKNLVASAANIVIFIALLGLPLRAVIVGFPIVDHSEEFNVYRYWRAALELPIEPGAIIIGNWLEINQVRYMQNVEGRRPDLLTVEGERAPDVLRLIQEKLPSGKPVYLTSGVVIPSEGHQYAVLGTLLRVEAAPNFNPKNSRPAAN